MQIILFNYCTIMTKICGFIPASHQACAIVATVFIGIAIVRIGLRAFNIDYEGWIVNGVRGLFTKE